MVNPYSTPKKIPHYYDMNKLLKRGIAAVVFSIVAGSAGAFTVDTATVATIRLATPMRVTVITPDGAEKATAPLPSVYVLNGSGGGYRDWAGRVPGFGNQADLYNIVLIMPDGRDSWYWDAPCDSTMQMESFFVKDLVPYMRAHYNTSADPRLTAITGLSMGGHGGLWLGTRHPDIWGNMGSTSGGVNIMPFPKNWKMERLLGPQEGNEQVWQEHTVASLVPQMKANGQNIIFDCGSEDFFAKVNADLHQALLDAKVPHDYISRPGKHNWPYWSNSILYQLLYFSRAFDRAMLEDQQQSK